ncbi:hypothetical protein [Desulfosarcina cetonica]|uniref:hypothetical protein n=1 Tax=Desulfosarcina cetonica TaxID=90730 RepID=UPI0006CFDE2A|nr:hypothetical protein [Desulfosarcina cetonica]
MRFDVGLAISLFIDQEAGNFLTILFIMGLFPDFIGNEITDGSQYQVMSSHRNPFHSSDGLHWPTAFPSLSGQPPT